MTRLVPLYFLLLPLILVSCNNSNNNNDEGRIGHYEEVDEESIFFDYRITAEEGDDNLTIMLQFREGGENGPTLVMDGAGKVELDGVKLTVDSSGLSGAFYELQKPILSFSGKHSIVFSSENKSYKEEFNFEPMVLKNEIPDTIGREEFIIELSGLEPEDYVRILLTDTSSTNDWINRLDTVKNGVIRLGADDFYNLSGGEIHLELHREHEKPVENGTREGGRIYLGYVIKRKFILRD